MPCRIRRRDDAVCAARRHCRRVRDGRVGCGLFRVPAPRPQLRRLHRLRHSSAGSRRRGLDPERHKRQGDRHQGPVLDQGRPAESDSRGRSHRSFRGPRRSHEPDHPRRSATDCRRFRAPRPDLLPTRLPQERSRLPDTHQDVPLSRASKLRLRPRSCTRGLGGRVAPGSGHRRARRERNPGRLLPLRESLPRPQSEDPVRN